MSGFFKNQDVARAEPRHSLYFETPLTEYGQTLENIGLSWGSQNTGKGKNAGVAPFGATCGFRFRSSLWCWIAKLVTHSGTGLVGAGDAAGRRTSYTCPPWSTLTLLGCLGWWGGGAWDRPNPQQSRRGAVSMVPCHKEERWTAVHGEVVQPWDALLPGPPCL